MHTLRVPGSGCWLAWARVWLMILFRITVITGDTPLSEGLELGQGDTVGKWQSHILTSLQSPLLPLLKKRDTGDDPGLILLERASSGGPTCSLHSSCTNSVLEPDSLSDGPPTAGL